MMNLEDWLAVQDDMVEIGGYDLLKSAWDYSQEQTAKRCKEISQQRYLAVNQAVSIDEAISSEFGLSDQ